MNFYDMTALIGGLAIFLHGLGLTREGLQIIAGERLRSILFALSNNRVVALFSGAFVTMILQSSIATTIMISGFTASSLMTLTQAMALLLGADIGTTMTVQLISFHLPAYALSIVSAGFIVRHVSRKKRNKSIGQVILGFGLLFLGMKLMEDATAPLRASRAFLDLVEYFGARPAAGLFAAAFATVVLQGSAPTIGLLIALSSSGSLTLQAAMPMVLGANIGTTITPILMTSDDSIEGRRVTVARAIFKVVGVALLFPFLPYFNRFVEKLEPGFPNRAIANGHTLFNLLNALFFLPLIGIGSRLIHRHYVPGKEKEKFAPKYLDLRALESPALAFGHAQREFLRMADLVNESLKEILKALGTSDLDLMAEIEARDDKVDILNREIRFYLAKVGQAVMTREQAERQVELVSLANDMENIGDIVSRDLVNLARKKMGRGLSFSLQGLDELREFHSKVCESFDLALTAYASQDEEIARRVIRNGAMLLTVENQLKEKHIERLHKGTRESIETSGIHLDVLTGLRQINGYIGGLAEAVIRAREAQALVTV